MKYLCPAVTGMPNRSVYISVRSMSPQSVVRNLGDRRAVGRRHLHHKAAVRVLRVSEAGDEKPAGSDPDVVKGHIVRAVDVCRGVLCDGYSENGAVGVQADEEVVPGQGRTVPDEGGFPVR